MIEIKIKALTKKTLKEALSLLDTVFPEGDEEEPANIALLASLNLEKYKDALSKMKIVELKYWTAIDVTGKIVGTIGLYHYEDDNDEEIWLGYFSVNPHLRKMGIGTQLLNFSINEARKYGKKFLRLWTMSSLRDAQKLYEKHGFKLTREKSLGDTELKKLYYKLKL